MALDLAQFHDAFFDESYEALDAMEAALLKLTIGAPEPELIGTIFRVAHSIKGGSATFGFSDVASFTHTCETLLDELRGNRMEVSRHITDLLLKSVDVMRDMLRGVQNKEPIDAQRVADLQFDLELAIAQKNTPAVVAPAPSEKLEATPVAASVSAQNAVRAAHRWQIAFRPHPQLFVHGNDPLRMLRELSELGEIEFKLDATNLPALDLVDPESCYFAWDLCVETDATRDVIDQVFDWAEGDCDLKIVDEFANNAAPRAAAPSLEPAAKEKLQAEKVVNINAGASSIAAAKSSTEITKSAPAEHVDSPKQGLGDGSSIRVSTEKIDELMNTVGELVITQSMLSELGAKVSGPVAEQLRSGLVQLERNMRELQESVMRVRMLPISFVFSRFPRMVRDLSQRLNK